MITESSNGMPDWWEWQYSIPVFAPSSPNNDNDGDGLSNLGEYLRGTKPNVADTDGDGLSDGAERTAVSDPLRFDLPDLALETSWREAQGEDRRSYGTGSNYPRLLFGESSNGNDTLPWTGTAPAAGTPVYALSTLDQIMGVSQPIPWSAWKPWEGSASSFISELKRGDNSVTEPLLPLLSHTFQRRDVRVRLRASRPMPVPWRIHLQRKVRTRNGAAGTPMLIVTDPNPVVFLIPQGQWEDVKTWQPSASVDAPLPTPSQPATEATVETFLTAPGTVVAPTSSDPDGDTLSTATENLIGSNPQLPDSDGDGVRDSEARVAALNTLRISLVSHTRKVIYDAGSSSGKSVVTGSWGFNGPPAAGVILYNSLHNTLSGAAFPASPAAYTEEIPESALNAEGASRTLSSPVCTHAELSHRRVRGILSAIRPHAVTRTFLKVTRRTAAAAPAPQYSAETVTLSFAANSLTSSNFVDLLPALTDNGGGEKVSVKLLPVGIMQHPITATSGSGDPPVTGGPIRFCRWIDAYPGGVRDNQFADKDVTVSKSVFPASFQLSPK